MKVLKKIIASKIVFLIVLFSIFLYEIYSYRFAYFTKWDKNYYRDLYDHSQWMLARSIRSVSDEQLYQVASYDLVTTWRFFTINPEAPVLAKYLYGFSLKFFNNSNLASLFLFVIAFFFFYLLINELIKNHILKKIALLLFLTEPLIFSQASITMLDLPQLVFLFLHLLMIVKILKSKKPKYYLILIFLILAGISLGGFISIKIGFFGLIILLVDFLFFYQIKKPLYLLPVIVISPIIYILSYLPYFFQNHSLIDFLRAQKWVLNYWLFSASAPRYLYGLVLSTMIFGITKGWYQNAVWEKVAEWTILWPVYLFALFYFLVKMKKNKKEIEIPLRYLIFLLTAFLIFNFFIPFFTRYLLLSLPLFIIIFVLLIPKINKKILTLLFIVFSVQFLLYLNPSPTQTIKGIEKNWSLGTYQDLYSYLDNNSKQRFNRYEFWRKLQFVEKNLCLNSRAVKINLLNFLPWKKTAEAKLTIDYLTCLGKISHTASLFIHKENNQWRIKWDDSLVLPNFSLDKDQVVSVIEKGRCGKIKLNENVVLSEAKPWPFFMVVPNQIKDEEMVQKQLFQLTGLKKHDLEYLYKANNQPDLPVEIGFLKPNFSLSKLEKLSLADGIVKEVRFDCLKYRSYHPAYIFQIKKIKYWEEYHRSNLNPTLGGMIKIATKNGRTKKILIKKEKVDGKDIIVKL